VPAGGYGQQGFGGYAFGAGGPLAVVRAVAVAGQVVRVVYDEEPLHRSPAGISDALNPSNYTLTVPGANATAPTPMGVGTTMVVGPAYAVGNGTGAAGERGFDVHVDRQLIAGVVYRITVRNLVAAAGGALGSPNAANFGGVTQLIETKPPARIQDLIDIQNPPATGHWVVDDSGDIAPEDPDAGTRKRIYRRLMTRRGAFRALPDYGIGFDLKSIANVATLSALKMDAIRQIKLEPDVVSADVTITVQQSTGLTIISARAKTRRGGFIDIGAKVTAIGQISPQ